MTNEHLPRHPEIIRHFNPPSERLGSQLSPWDGPIQSLFSMTTLPISFNPKFQNSRNLTLTMFQSGDRFPNISRKMESQRPFQRTQELGVLYGNTSKI